MSESMDRDTFMDYLTQYAEAIGLESTPHINGQAIDLYQLYELAKQIGGYSAISLEGWEEMASLLGCIIPFEIDQIPLAQKVYDAYIRPGVEYGYKEAVRIHRVIEKFGGYDAVCRKQLWDRIAKAMGLPIPYTEPVHPLSKIYFYYLLDFEKYADKPEYGIKHYKDLITSLAEASEQKKQNVLKAESGQSTSGLVPPFSAIEDQDENDQISGDMAHLKI